MQPYLDYAIKLAEEKPAQVFTHVALVDGNPMLIYGVMPAEIDRKVGIVWMIAHTDAKEKWRQLHAACLYDLDKMQAMYATLRADVYAENALHMRWLAKLGFYPIDTYSKPPFGCQFIAFERRRKET